MSKLEEMRKRLMEMEGRKSSSPNKKTGGDNAVFPFWNMKDGEESKIRFLPDGNESNIFFWVEKQMINIPFSGIEGDPSAGEVTVSVPCIEMYGKDEQCPIHQEIRPWYKQGDKNLEELASVYWKKRTFIAQGFVRDTKLPEADKPESPIRMFFLKPQVYNIIKAIIMDPDNKTSPTDIEDGIDFYLSKTTKGKWADYTSSRWARGSTPLTQEERNAIGTFGLKDLSQFLPKKPTPEEMRIQMEMFEVSVDGGKYDPERWGKYYKPRGYEVHTKETVQEAVSVTTQSNQSVNEEDDIPFEVNAPVATPEQVAQVQTNTSQSVKEILARVHARNKSV